MGNDAKVKSLQAKIDDLLQSETKRKLEKE